MSALAFDRAAGFLTAAGKDGTPIGKWPAANNVDSHSHGQWPKGIFNFAYVVAHPGDDENSAYGSHGILVFTVPGRYGMGVHSGRQDIPDGLHRIGVEHCTMGCIRTTDDAMAAIVAMHKQDPIAVITVTIDQHAQDTVA